jgi:DNA-binding transcriptional MerR regulator
MIENWTLTTGAVARQADTTGPTVTMYAAMGLVPFRNASNGMRLFSTDAPAIVRSVKAERLSRRGKARSSQGPQRTEKCARL